MKIEIPCRQVLYALRDEKKQYEYRIIGKTLSEVQEDKDLGDIISYDLKPLRQSTVELPLKKQC